METRVRFAPSPTGNVHIGNIRAAIFNWLYARHTGGKFLLRVEDTDRERSTPAAIATLLEVMAWLKLDFDEPIVYQTAQAGHHRAMAEQLIAAGHAYRHVKGEGTAEATLFRIPWDLASCPFVRRVGPSEIALHGDVPLRIGRNGLGFAQVSSKGAPVPREACLAGFRELEVLDAAGQVMFTLEPAIGDILASPSPRTFPGAAKLRYVRHEVYYTDLVKGELTKPVDSLNDFIIVRSDGNPVFHLGNVVDDITQRITHIIRGDDHVENTYRHLFLFHTLGAPAPAYAHLPMIVNAAGKPYSKRDGDAYVGDYRAKGYLADALFNYLTLLGWSPGNDVEKLSREETIKLFELARVKSSAAQMDIDKLFNMNGMYLAEMSPAVFAEQAWEQAADQPWRAVADRAFFDRVAALMQTRTKLIVQAKEWGYFFTDTLVFDEKLVQKHLQKPGMRAPLLDLALAVAGGMSSEADYEGAIHGTTAAHQIAQGKLNLPLRLALTGSHVGAGLYETMALLGPARCAARLHYAAETFCPA